MKDMNAGFNSTPPKPPNILKIYLPQHILSIKITGKQIMEEKLRTTSENNFCLEEIFLKCKISHKTIILSLRIDLLQVTWHQVQLAFHFCFLNMNFQDR